MTMGMTSRIDIVMKTMNLKNEKAPNKVYAI